MDFLYLLESIRIPVLNDFMLAITYLGDEIAFLVVALILMWCVDKRTGYYMLSVMQLRYYYMLQFLKHRLLMEQLAYHHLINHLQHLRFEFHIAILFGC